MSAIVIQHRHFVYVSSIWWWPHFSRLCTHSKYTIKIINQPKCCFLRFFFSFLTFNFWTSRVEGSEIYIKKKKKKKTAALIFLNHLSPFGKSPNNFKSPRMATCAVYKGIEKQTLLQIHHNQPQKQCFTKLNRYFIWQYNSLCIRLNWNEKRIGSRNHFLCLPTLVKLAWPAWPVYRLSRRNRTNGEEGPRWSGAEAEGGHLRGTIFLAT